MNKIHSCTQVKPAAACSFLSLPRASCFLGCLWGGVAWSGWGLTPEPFAGSWCRGSHWLTHLHLLPEIAAQQLAPLWCHHCPAQEGSPLPTPGGGGAQRASRDTASDPHAPATRAHSAASPTSTRSPTLAHTSPCCWPQAQGNTGQACAGVSPQAAVGMNGDRGTCATFPALWHLLPHAGTFQPGPPTTWVGVTRTRCPCTPPWPGRLGQRPWCRMGWGGGAVGTNNPAPHSQCQHPHFPPQPSRMICPCQGEGMGGREPLPTRWMGEIKPDLVYWLQSLESWLLSSSARKGQGGDTESPEHPCPPWRRPSIPVLLPITHITGQLAGGCTGSLSPTCEDRAT